MDNKVKILYVDDEIINTMLFKIMFLQRYDVEEAESGFKGLEVLKEKPDIMVVISDMKMPLMNGIEFITKAKSLYPDKYFCILTGYEITAEIQESLSKGLIFKSFLKPFKMDEIISAIEEEILNRHL